VFLLSIKLHGPSGQSIDTKLPCPRGDFYQWLSNGQTKHLDSSSALLRQNPTLLLTAISQAVNCSGSRIASLSQLRARLKHCLDHGNALDTLLGPVESVATLSSTEHRWNVHIESEMLKFGRSRSRKSLIKSLATLLRIYNKQYVPKEQQTKKKAFRKLLESMFDERFEMPKSKISVRNWKRVAGDSTQAEDASLIALIQERSDEKQLFASKLHEAKLASMKQLAYGASHEINNPLANIATRAQAMLLDESDPDRRYRLAVIHEQAMRAHDMISDLMLFAHPPKLCKRPTDIRFMLTSLSRECESNFACLSQTNIELRFTVAPEVNTAILDPTQCKVLLGSLIRNAAEAIRSDEGQIEVRAYICDSSLCFCVDDNGIGIDETVKDHLFDPFYSGREAGRGLGFGLSKSWRIAQLHGGTLSHEPGTRELETRFVFRLPLSIA
jgi:signal transduction histidine kinase